MFDYDWISDRTAYVLYEQGDEWIAKSYTLDGDLVDETRYSYEPTQDDVEMDLHDASRLD
jgi:hypothetical protein